jgi:O-antigen ligase
MTLVGTAGRYPATPLKAGWIGLAVPALAVVGYVAVSDLRVSAALVIAAALAAWGALSYHRPRLGLSVSFPIPLIAATKFRIRDAAASLDGVMDAQILLEIALFAVIGVGLLAVWIAGRGDRRGLKAVEALILGYTAIALMSTLWSLAPALTLVRAIQLLIVSALAIVAVRVLTPSGALWTACTAVAAYVLVCAGLASIFPWASGTFYHEDGFRFAWFSMHPVSVGTLAAIAALGLLSASVFGPPDGPPRKLGLPLPCYAIALVLVLVLTNSRAPLLAFVAGLGIVMLMRVRSSLRAALLLMAAAVVLMCIALGPDVRAWLGAAANQDSAMSRLFFRGQSADAVLGLSGRMELWDDLRPAIAGHALVGYGYQASRSVVLDVASWAAYAHNALLQTVLDLGLIGTLTLVALVTIGLFGGMRRGLTPWMRATVAALIVFLVLNSVSTESFAGSPGFETLLLFICVLCAVS